MYFLNSRKISAIFEMSSSPKEKIIIQVCPEHKRLWPPIEPFRPLDGSTARCKPSFWCPCPRTWACRRRQGTGHSRPWCSPHIHHTWKIENNGVRSLHVIILTQLCYIFKLKRRWTTVSTTLAALAGLAIQKKFMLDKCSWFQTDLEGGQSFL